jgi:hypothetical protein
MLDEINRLSWEISGVKLDIKVWRNNIIKQDDVFYETYTQIKDEWLTRYGSVGVDKVIWNVVVAAIRFKLVHKLGIDKIDKRKIIESLQ